MLIVVAIFQCRKNKESEEIEMKTRTKEDDGKAGNDVIQPEQVAPLSSKMADRAIGVFIHESELLKMDFLVSHPVVKVRYTFYE